MYTVDLLLGLQGCRILDRGTVCQTKQACILTCSFVLGCRLGCGGLARLLHTKVCGACNLNILLFVRERDNKCFGDA